MEILEIGKGKILYNEKDTTHNLFYILDGSFETSKQLQVHQTEKGEKVDYFPFVPSEEINLTQRSFFDENSGLLKSDYEKPKFNAQLTSKKPKNFNCRLCITGAKDFVGLEEVLMQDSQRFTKVEGVSKYARVVRINAQKLFKKFNDQDVIADWQEYSKKKLAIIAKGIKTFLLTNKKVQKKQKREETKEKKAHYHTASAEIIKTREAYDSQVEHLFRQNVMKSIFKFNFRK